MDSKTKTSANGVDDYLKVRLKVRFIPLDDDVTEIIDEIIVFYLSKTSISFSFPLIFMVFIQFNTFFWYRVDQLKFAVEIWRWISSAIGLNEIGSITR